MGYVSTTEAESMGVLCHILSEFMQVNQPIYICMDNQDAIFMATHLVTDKRHEHINLRRQLIRDLKG